MYHCVFTTNSLTTTRNVLLLQLLSALYWVTTLLHLLLMLHMLTQSQQPTNKMTIHFIADKTSFYDQLQDIFTKKDIQVTRATRSEQMANTSKGKQPHLFILDCPHQDIEDLTLCQEIRNCYSGLLVVISKTVNEQFQTLTLNIGADASINSQDGLSLITANIQALLRRFIVIKNSPQLLFEGLTIDKNKRDAFINEKAAKLSSIEFQLIWSLAQKPGCVISRDEIHQNIYNASYNGYDRSIDLYVSRIRQKLGDDPICPHYLKTVRGIGYQFVGTEKRGFDTN